MTHSLPQALPVQTSGEIRFEVPLSLAGSVESATETVEPSAELLMAMRRAQQLWSARALRERLSVVRRFREMLADDCASVSTTMGRNTNCLPAEIVASQIMPLLDACRFLERSASKNLRTRSLGANRRPLFLWGVRGRVRRDAHGIVLIIAPSNYPLFLPGVQALQALVAGNAVLLKPGNGGNETARILANLLSRAGLPPNGFHLLPEAPDSARAVINIGVDKVVFTGAAPTGVSILQQLAPHLTPAIMELSGCDAVIVRADADLGLVARAIAFGLRLNAGETCIAPRRIFVPEQLATELEGRLAATFDALPDLPLSQKQRDNARRIAAQSLTRGAHLVVGNVTSEEDFRAPMIIAGVPPDSPLLNEDYFAPIATLITVRDDEEALKRVAACPYALGVSIFSRDMKAAEQMGSRIHAGVLTINDLIAPTADPRLPFGGRGRSGFGVTRGAEGLLDMTVPKVILRRTGALRLHYAPLNKSHTEGFAAFARLAHAGHWKTRLRALWQLIRLRGRHCSDKEVKQS